MAHHVVRFSLHGVRLKFTKGHGLAGGRNSKSRGPGHLTLPPTTQIHQPSPAISGPTLFLVSRSVSHGTGCTFKSHTVTSTPAFTSTGNWQWTTHATPTNPLPRRSRNRGSPAFEQAVQALEEMTIIGWFAGADGASWTATINSTNAPSLTKVIHIAERSFPAMNKRVAAWEYFDSTGNSEPKQTKISSKIARP